MRNRKHVITILPGGGARITLSGFLPDRSCARCNTEQLPAADFMARVYACDGVRKVDFSNVCMRCAHTRTFPADLRALRFTSTYRDDTGKICGWYERTREGTFGDELSLELLRIRRMADGVYRPQPKLDRRSKEKQKRRPMPPRPHRKVRDSRRNFPRSLTLRKARAQGNRCPGCRRLYTVENPPCGDHVDAWARGYATVPENHQVLCKECNLRKGAKKQGELW